MSYYVYILSNGAHTLEVYRTANEAEARERQIKGWKRAKKVALIQSVNPYWKDLAKPGPRLYLSV